MFIMLKQKRTVFTLLSYDTTQWKLCIWKPFVGPLHQTNTTSKYTTNFSIYVYILCASIFIYNNKRLYDFFIVYFCRYIHRYTLNRGLEVYIPMVAYVLSLF